MTVVDFPPLPEPVGTVMTGYVQHEGQRMEQVEDCFTADQMREYVLADRAARGAEVRPTGPEPDLAQDANRKLHRALASKPDARLHAREAAQAIERERTDGVKACENHTLPPQTPTT